MKAILYTKLPYVRLFICRMSEEVLDTLGYNFKGIINLLQGRLKRSFLCLICFTSALEVKRKIKVNYRVS